MTEKLRAALQKMLAVAKEEWGHYPPNTNGQALIAEAEAALASPDMEQRAGWMPIETAPKDGTRVLLAEDGWVGEAQYDTRRKGWWQANTHWTDSYKKQYFAPTAWQPLPAHPIEALEGGKTDLGASGALGASGVKGAQA